MKKLINYFLQGMLYIAPISITVYIVYLVFTFVDGLLQSWLKELIDVTIPGLGLILIFLIILLVGFLGQTILAKPIVYLFDRLMKKAPLLKVLYSAINDLFSAFVGKEKKFNNPVLVKINVESNIEKLGFVTEMNLKIIGEKDKVAVYFPHSYNFSGELFIVPGNQVRRIDLPPAEVMKFIVSAGVAGFSETEKIKD